MGVGAILEPLVVVVLLFGGTWINRVVNPSSLYTRRKSNLPRTASSDSLESGYSTSTKDGLLGSRSHSPSPDDRWHKRQVGLLGFKFEVPSPNTVVFQDRLLSRVLRKFPFLVECWYWALVYWVSLGWLTFDALMLLFPFPFPSPIDVSADEESRSSHVPI